MLTLCNNGRSTFYSVIVTNHFMKYLFLFLQFLLKNTGTPFRFTRLNQIKTSSGHARLSVKLSRRLTVRTQNEEQSKSCLQHLLCMHSNRTEYKLTENTNAINHSTQGSGLKVLEKREEIDNHQNQINKMFHSKFGPDASGSSMGISSAMSYNLSLVQCFIIKTRSIR